MSRYSDGFSLIELMIVVAIIAILAGIAYPSYQSHVLKTRRAEAKEALTSIAAKQERWFFQFNQYTTNPADLDVRVESGVFLTVEGNYAITISDDPCDSGDCFRAIATARGLQAEDTDCAILTLQHTGVRRSFRDSSTETTTTANCW